MTYLVPDEVMEEAVEALDRPRIGKYADSGGIPALRAILDKGPAKPVAWINVEERRLESAAPMLFVTGITGTYPPIPLYAEPTP